MNGMTVCHKTPHRSPNLKTIEPERIIKHKHSHSPKVQGQSEACNYHTENVQQRNKVDLTAALFSVTDM